MFREFKRMAKPHVRFMPGTESEWLALAQHHGLPTRLLDWTANPLTALFFSVESPSPSEAVVWCYKPRFPELPDGADPFQITEPHVVFPPHVSPRITGQFGRFTIHPAPYSDIRALAAEPGRLFCITVKAQDKGDMRADLSAIGVNHASVFPDLDGICRYIRWSETLAADEFDPEDLP